MSNKSQPAKHSVLGMMLLGWIGLLTFIGDAASAPGGQEVFLEEKNVVAFDPSFEKSLFGVQDRSKWKMTRTLHVNPASKAADDKGPGTADKPLKTVVRAVEMVRPGTRVLIYPGLYRESITLQKAVTLDQSGTAESPIVIEAKEPGTVVFSGSDVWTDWKPEGNGVYSAAWPHKWGTNPWMSGRSKPIGRRFELVFIDGELLKQVLERKEMKPGTYCADETAEKLYIWLKDSAKPQDHKIEVAVRGGLEHGAGLTVGDMWDVELLPSYIAVKGIAFKHYTRHFFLGKHVLLEDCRFEYTNDMIGIGGEDFVLRRVVGLHTGGCTFFMPPRGEVPGKWKKIENQHLNGLMEDVTASYGNWRLYSGGMVEWATAGSKVHSVTNLILRRCKMQYNDSPGFWADTKCNNVLVEDGVFTHNRLYGVWMEINNGESVVRDNILACNLVRGINISNTCHLTIEGNTFYGNKKAQIGHWHKGPIRRSLEGGFRTVNLKVINNRFVATEAEQFLIRLPGYDYIPETGTFANNLYYQSGHRSLFEFGQQMDFDRWQQAVGETGSILADPMFRNPEALDFTPMPGSPLLHDAPRPNADANHAILPTVTNASQPVSESRAREHCDNGSSTRVAINVQ